MAQLEQGEGQGQGQAEQGAAHGQVVEGDPQQGRGGGEVRRIHQLPGLAVA